MAFHGGPRESSMSNMAQLLENNNDTNMDFEFQNLNYKLPCYDLKYPKSAISDCNDMS